MFSTGDIIELAIQIERNAEAICRRALKKKIDPLLASLLEWMADEELKHIEWFQGLKESAQILKQNSQLEKIGKDLLSSVLGKQSFSLSDADFTQVNQINDLIALLIEFEDDTVLFYEMIKSVVSDPKTSMYLDMIIQEETQHKKKLQEHLEECEVQ
jgi:rubrerythrin